MPTTGSDGRLFSDASVQLQLVFAQLSFTQNSMSRNVAQDSSKNLSLDLSSNMKQRHNIENLQTRANCCGIKDIARVRNFDALISPQTYECSKI